MKFHICISDGMEAVAPAKVVMIIKAVKFLVGAKCSGLIANSAEVSDGEPMLNTVMIYTTLTLS